jgi:hypothetical protein
MRLWSYGDSHAAGHELGVVDDLGRAWLKEHTGYDHRLSARENLGDRYNDYVKNKWYDYVESILVDASPTQCSPHLSYAGKYAEKLNVEFINRAVPGAGNDMILRRMFHDIALWNEDDYILVTHVDYDRYMPQHDTSKLNYKSYNLPFKVQDTFEQYGPSEISFKLWNQGIVSLMKSLHPNTKLISSVPTDMTVDDVNTIDKLRALPMSFTEFVQSKWDAEDMRYPGGHFHEECHEKFAEYLFMIG